MTGAIVRTAPAAKTPRLAELLLPATMARRPTARVFVELSVRKIDPRMNSEITPTNARRKVVAMIGLSVGSRMMRNTCQWVQPSMMAASSSSLGTVSNVPLMSQTCPSAPPMSARQYPLRVLRPRKGMTLPRSLIME